MKIDINKQYRTRDGREVKLFTTEGPNPDYPVIGTMRSNKGNWFSSPDSWTSEGKTMMSTSSPQIGDLVEYTPKWRGEVWLNRETGEVRGVPVNNKFTKITVEEVTE